MFRSMDNTPFNPQTGQYWAMGYPDMFKSFFVKEQLDGDVILCEDGKGNLIRVGLPFNMQQSVYESSVFLDGLTYTWGGVETTTNYAGEVVSWQQERVVSGEKYTDAFTEKITPAYRKGESILCIKILSKKDSNVKWVDVNTAGRCWTRISDVFPHRDSDPWAVIIDDDNARATVINAGLTGVSGAWMEAAPLYVTAAGYVYGMLAKTTPGYWSFSTHFTTSLSDTVESVADIEAETVKVKAFEFEMADIGSGKKAVRIKRDWIHGGIYVDKSASASDVIPLVDSGGGVAGESISVSRDDHQHPANVDATVPLLPATAGSAGTAEVYSRNDHQHPLNVDDTDPEAVGSAGASGSATTYAKRDHVHAGAALGAAIPLKDSGTGSAGTAEAASREDHVHPPDIELSDVAPPWSSEASAGESELAARSDHGHYIPLGAYLPHPLQQAAFTPLVDVVDGAIGGVGLYQEGAFFDHQHPTNVDDTDPEDVAAVASPGTADVYARRDHVHAGVGAVGDATPLVDSGEGVVGVATSSSREDHQHPLNVGATAALAPATTGLQGSSDVYSRDDHVHPARASQGALSTMENSGIAAAQTEFSWAVGNVGLQPVKRWFHRYYYDGTTGAEKIVGVQHYEINDAVTGALVEVSAESIYTMHTPEYEA